MVTSHTYQEQTDSDDQSIEASVEIPSDDEYADITRILRATSIETETTKGVQSSSLNPQEINTPPPSGGPLFTIDVILRSQWRKRFLDFKAWMDAKMVAPDSDRYRVIKEFCSHMTGVLKEWYSSLGLVRQDELHRLENTDTVVAALHHEFLGDHNLVQKEIRKEYFDIKCCSLKKPDLECHFKRMA